MEIRDFKAKPIFERLLAIDRDRNMTLDEKERTVLSKELALSLPTHIQQIKESDPDIKEEDVRISCLTELGFSSIAIGCMLNLTANAIRQRKHRKKRTKEGGNTRM